MPIRVLVVDDSALMRRVLSEILSPAHGFEPVTARDGEDALRLLPEVKPQVVTLDINMPVMDGLTCLSRIMTEHPVPVVMVSSLTQEGALATLEALAMGAVSYVTKPGGTVSVNLRDIGADIVAAVKAAARARARAPRSLARTSPRAVPRMSAPARPVVRPAIGALASTAGKVALRGLVLMGSSTGGPQTLEEILPYLPGGFPYPVLVAQHMPAAFTCALAERLAKCCALEVEELSRAQPLVAGKVLIARGDADTILSERAGQLWACPAPADAHYTWHPSVERMTRSALEHVTPERLIAVELTGMGDDGAPAMSELRRRGGRTIAEAEATCVVYGMPRALVELGGATVVLPCHQVAAQLVAWSEESERTWAS
jgi:two-component system chemotaxis response regulator CheB